MKNKNNTSQIIQCTIHSIPNISLEKAVELYGYETIMKKLWKRNLQNFGKVNLHLQVEE